MWSKIELARQTSAEQQNRAKGCPNGECQMFQYHCIGPHLPEDVLLSNIAKTAFAKRARIAPQVLLDIMRVTAVTATACSWT